MKKIFLLLLVVSNYCFGQITYISPNTGVLPTASLTIASGGTTTVNAQSYPTSNFYSTSSATATTFTYSNIGDGAVSTISYSKTTASDLNITFGGTAVISAGSDGAIVSNVITLSSTVNGRFTITIRNVNGTYFVFIIQNVL